MPPCQRQPQVKPHLLNRVIQPPIFLFLSTEYTQEQSQNNNLYHLTALRHLREICQLNQ